MKKQLLTLFTIGLLGTLTAQQNLGVDQPNPQAKVHITNTTNQKAMLVEDEANDATPFVIDSVGNVGVQTATPTVALEVNGRIKDKTGYVMPVGSVISFAGVVIPEGWLLCDGSVFAVPSVSDSLYELFITIQNYWGGDGITTFYLPNMQGKFLRGVDNGTGLDPDAAIRSGTTGGNTGDNVGSTQSDALQGHFHRINFAGTAGATYNLTTNAGGAGGITQGTTSSGTEISIDAPLTDGVNGVPKTTSETRPVNVYVNYIIKY